MTLIRWNGFLRKYQMEIRRSTIENLLPVNPEHQQYLGHSLKELQGELSGSLLQKNLMQATINKSKPYILHVDLNSAFATIEQQANPLLRGKPLVVAAYGTPNAFILAPSIEAKRIGIKMGMRVRDAQEIYPKVVVRTPDAPKYRDVHLKFKKIFQDYSPVVTPKSIDEAIIDFRPVTNLHHDLIGVAKEIKQRMKDEIGEWIFCSIGIGTNMFLAKLGATLHKPDGLTFIDHTNLIKTYQA